MNTTRKYFLVKIFIRGFQNHDQIFGSFKENVKRSSNTNKGSNENSAQVPTMLSGEKLQPV